MVISMDDIIIFNANKLASSVIASLTPYRMESSYKQTISFSNAVKIYLCFSGEDLFLCNGWIKWNSLAKRRMKLKDKTPIQQDIEDSYFLDRCGLPLFWYQCQCMNLGYTPVELVWRWCSLGLLSDRGLEDTKWHHPWLVKYYEHPPIKMSYFLPICCQNPHWFHSHSHLLMLSEINGYYTVTGIGLRRKHFRTPKVNTSWHTKIKHAVSYMPPKICISC